MDNIDFPAAGSWLGSQSALLSPNDQIELLKNEIAAKFKEIEKIADANGIEVYFSGPAYGFGGSYRPERMDHDRAVTLIKTGQELTPGQREQIVELLTSGRDYDWRSSEETGWVSSSSGC